MTNPPRLMLDIEVYRNYFLVMFLADDGRTASFEMFDGQPLNEEGVRRMLTCGAEITTFNGANFDLPLVRLALMGADCSTLKDAADEIIEGNLKGWQFAKKYPQDDTPVNHVDLMEVAPGRNSLKIYGGRLHCPKLQDLPIEPGALIEPEQRPMLRRYCKNDLETTRALADALSEQLALRRAMGDHLREELEAADVAHLLKPEDLRSKSDAQIAEAVLKQRVFIRTGAIPRKRPAGYRKFNYEPPEYIRFGSENLREALDLIRSSDMVVSPDTGHVDMPEAIKKLTLTIGSTTYKLGIGGIHSQESEVSHYADDEVYLRDIDVVSYYPNLMLNMGMYPDSMGPHFLSVYRDILDERVAAKRAGEKVKADSLKITLNGTFGKTSSQYSVLYNPRMMIATTLTGQLSLLMLIEAFERFGIPVISANTDGVVIKCPRRLEEKQRLIVQRWEKATNLETEETNYRSIHSRDVNSYVAIKTDGGVKTKGFFALPPPGKTLLNKSPQNEICVQAAVDYLVNGTPVEQTIRRCSDIRRFLTVRQVTGGAVKDDEHLGKAIRWYYSDRIKGVIRYAKDGKVVGKSRHARPLMNLPEAFPPDVDMDWYVAEAQSLLMDMAVIPRPPKPKLPRRGTKAWKALEEQGLVEVDEYGKPAWTVHYDEVPDEYRVAAVV